MANTVRDYLSKIKRNRQQRNRMAAILMVLSVMVASGVVWQLRQTGISMTGEVYCGKEEHTHTEECKKTTEAETVTETVTELTCTLPEHTHTDACIQKTLICGQEECEPHTHSVENFCYTTNQVLTCTTPEHTHSAEAGCYDEEGNLICTQEEHTHGEGCYTEEQTLVCTLPETEGHTHTDACYETTYICGAEEHTHSDSCYETKEVEVASTADEDTDFTSGDSDFICGLEEHTHSLACYSNPEADVETAATWEATISGATLTGEYGKDVAAIAKTQIGYHESTENYNVETAADGTETAKGYTRYGAWYGKPYEDWSAMFASFCIKYANVDYSVNDSCTDWISTLSANGQYATKDSWTPAIGDLVFIDTNGDGAADHVGIVSELANESIKAIVGDSSDEVKENSYSLSDESITGYGVLPVKETEEATEGATEETEAATEEVTGETGEAAEGTGETEKETTVDESETEIFTEELDGAVITAEAPAGTFPEGTTMKVSKLEGEDLEEAEETLKENGSEFDGAVAYDVTFCDSEGNKVEPANGNSVKVTMSLDKELFPDDVDSESLSIKHLNEEDGNVNVEEVAGVGDGVSVEDGSATAVFSVNSFSVMIASYDRQNGGTSTAADSTTNYTVEAGSNVTISSVSTNSNSWQAVNSSGTKESSISVSKSGGQGRDSSGTLTITTTSSTPAGTYTIQYKTSGGGKGQNQTGSWTDSGYTVTVTAAKTTYTVYVYVAAKDLDGNVLSDECLKLLGIDKSTLDGNNYFPAGQIEISKSMIDSQSGSTTAGQALINSKSDWETVLAALGSLDTSTLIDEGGVSYTLNKGNKVGDYIGQAAADIGYTWGTQRTALFRWNGSEDYGFTNIDTYHLDLRFTTNKITFIYGNNGITTGEATDENTVDTRVYITGSEIQTPTDFSDEIPEHYVWDKKYYSDADCTTEWNGIGTKISSDETVYIKLVPEGQLFINYEVAEGEGTVSPVQETLYESAETAEGSTPTAGEGYVFAGWYTNEDCTTAVETTWVDSDNKITPQKPSGGWVNGTTYYAKFVPDNYKVYVYVCGKTQDGDTLSYDCLELLGIDPGTVDGEGYFPVGEIQLDNYLKAAGYNLASDVDQDTALIKDETIWNAIKQDVGGLYTTTLVEEGDKDYKKNKDNTVKQYIDYCIVEYNKYGGNQIDTMMRRNDESFKTSYGFDNESDADVRFHLDLAFKTNKIQFILGNNGITDGTAKDLTEVDSRVYITGMKIQKPKDFSDVIPEGYTWDEKYYTDADFTEEWDEFGQAIYADKQVYIKLTKKTVNLVLEKTVTGVGDSDDWTFTFSVKSSTKIPGSLPDGAVYVGDDNKKVQCTLTGTGNETNSITLTGIEVGSTLNIGESDATNYTSSVTIKEDNNAVDNVKISGENYEATHTVSEYTIGLSATSVEVEITNTYNPTPIDLEIVKTDQTGTTKLAGAKFKLEKAVTSSSGDTTYEIVGEEKESDEDGLISFGNLAEGSYKLTETKAPDGYNLLENPITFEVKGGKLTEFTNITANKLTKNEEIRNSDNRYYYSMQIENSTGLTLPNTGGNGTLMYTLSGLLLMMGAALVYGCRLGRRREGRAD